MKKDSAGRSIGILSNKIRRMMGAMIFTEEFSGAQGRTLHFLLANEDRDIFQKDLEEEFGLRPPSATALLNKLEKNGLIRREPVACDARLKKIVATEKARQHKEQVIAGLEAIEDRLTAGISREDMQVFFSVVQKMLRNLS
ncbi:MAG: MarR family transcriptional regulator [Eubacteriales bacterium]|nr:MarR family transcriptional regulator [Eubacteriales bacterium]